MYEKKIQTHFEMVIFHFYFSLHGSLSQRQCASRKLIIFQFAHGVIFYIKKRGLKERAS